MASLDGKLYTGVDKKPLTLPDNGSSDRTLAFGEDDYILYTRGDDPNSSLLEAHHMHLSLKSLVCVKRSSIPTQAGKTAPTLFTRIGPYSGHYESNVKTIHETLSRLGGNDGPGKPYTDYVLYTTYLHRKSCILEKLCLDARVDVNSSFLDSIKQDNGEPFPTTLFTRHGGHFETNYATILKTLGDLGDAERSDLTTPAGDLAVDPPVEDRVASILKKAACDLIDTATIPTLRRIIDNLIDC